MNINFPKIIKLSLQLAVLVFAAWIFVHALALFGAFLAVAYLIWWYSNPRQSLCLACNAQKDGSFCIFCRQKVIKKNGTHPKRFISALYNSLLLLVFTGAALGIVLAENKLLTTFTGKTSSHTVSISVPTKGQYKLQEVFPVVIEVADSTTPINTIQADLSFDPKALELVDITTESSFATVFIQKEINNSAGFARLTGGIPYPGFSGKKGVFAKAFFKGKIPGIAKIQFLPSSLVLINDGKGTNILKDLPSFSYLILPETLSQQELSKQRNTLTKISAVIQETRKTQIVLYDEDPTDRVLVAAQQNEIQQSLTKKPATTIYDLIQQLDGFILKAWRSIIKIGQK